MKPGLNPAQVVSTSTMAVGARHLAAQKAIVARLSAIEELAGMSMLCSDKVMDMDSPPLLHAVKMLMSPTLP